MKAAAKNGRHFFLLAYYHRMSVRRASLGNNCITTSRVRERERASRGMSRESGMQLERRDDYREDDESRDDCCRRMESVTVSGSFTVFFTSFSLPFPVPLTLAFFHDFSCREEETDSSQTRTQQSLSPLKSGRRRDCELTATSEAPDAVRSRCPAAAAAAHAVVSKKPGQKVESGV